VPRHKDFSPRLDGNGRLRHTHSSIDGWATAKGADWPHGCVNGDWNVCGVADEEANTMFVSPMAQDAILAASNKYDTDLAIDSNNSLLIDRSGMVSTGPPLLPSSPCPVPMEHRGLTHPPRDGVGSCHLAADWALGWQDRIPSVPQAQQIMLIWGGQMSTSSCLAPSSATKREKSSSWSRLSGQVCTRPSPTAHGSGGFQLGRTCLHSRCQPASLPRRRAVIMRD